MQTTTATPAVTAPQFTTITIPRIGAEWPEQGGIFLGIVAGAEGQPDHLLIVGPAADTLLNHADAMKWARGLQHRGFADWDLPNRNDGAVAFGNGRAHFQPDWYWLSEQYAGNDAWAWYQYFNYGNQNYSYEHYVLRARAVRRLAI
jgi:hypothetical protein